jgi:formate/nitrite transporter
MTQDIRIDALLPAEMAKRAEYIGVRKAEMPLLTTLVLAILAGGFISMGAVFATTVSAGTSGVLPYGVSRLLTGVVFCLGLVLVVVGGAELFTGNISTVALLRNWGVVYIGNFIGSVGTAFLVYFSGQYEFGGGAVGGSALSIAQAKVNLGFVNALALGILCNALVCLAIWMSFSARSTIDKIAVIVFPITAFVAAGFEHSVANMYFVPIGLLVKTLDPAFALGTGLDLSRLTWANFLVDNLVPVTLGNIIGGSLLVAVVYWFVFLRFAEESA